MNKGKLAFEKKDRGFSVKAYYLKEPNDGEALIQIFKEDNDGKDKLYREFFFPAYKIWNIAAHFSDIVDGELDNTGSGYKMAGDTGLGGNVFNKQ